VDEAKPFDIPKREVWEAFKKVKANQGANPTLFAHWQLCHGNGRTSGAV
jgi:hypothetical protein